MPLTITHSTPADGTFSATGATAWNANHSFTVSGTSGELQYNNAGDFAGMSGTSWDNTTRSLTLTGATVTASAPVLDVSQTWNNAAVTFTGLKANFTDTASNAASLLLDLQRGSVSQFSVGKTGTVTFSNGALFSIAAGLDLATNSIARSGSISFGPSSDLIISRRTAANLRLGQPDAAAPVAQTLSVQSVVAGTTNTAGANLTITGSQGTGTGAGGSIIFQVAPAGSSGTAQNALATALTIDSTRLATFSNAIGLGAAGSVWRLIPTGTTSLVFWDTSNSDSFAVGPYNQGIAVTSAGSIGWSSTTSPSLTSRDVILVRDGAPNTLALRNGTAAQTFNVYNTFDGTNNERLSIGWSSNVLRIGTSAAGTGSNRSLEIQVGTTRKMVFPTVGGWQLFNGSTRESYQNWDAFTVRSDTYIGFASGTSVPQGQGDANFARVAPAIIGVRGGDTATGGALSFIEQTAPAAPAANGVYIYAEDNGSGKTRLMARFATGAAVQIAIEP